ncbi:hypothetical protein [Quadrisphaera sp. KR29]|uniref:hypothetical protein n=1 Tax=Quadrisphaera sp. KR29 TaxID=3461391 RepID=UPI0040442A5C
MHLTRRALAASALALASLTAATGCTATNRQQTLDTYAPGAVASTSLGTVHVGGLFVAADGEGAAALVARIVNQGDDPVSVEISDQDGGSGLQGTFDVEPGTTYDVGPGGDDSVTASSFDQPPGQVITMRVSAGGQDRDLAVPVLDGTLEQFAQYVPTPTPTASPTPRDTGEPSATGTRTGSPSASGTDARSATGAPEGDSSETASGSPSDG